MNTGRTDHEKAADAYADEQAVWNAFRHVDQAKGINVDLLLAEWAGMAAGVLEAVKGFRRLKGHADMPKLVAALRARDQQLGVVDSVEHVA